MTYRHDPVGESIGVVRDGAVGESLVPLPSAVDLESGVSGFLEPGGCEGGEGREEVGAVG